jgi:hypothetical protein
LVLWGLLSTHTEWMRRRLRMGVGLVAASVLPYLAWCTLRWILVGHFGLVSLGGYAAVAIPGLWLTTDDLVPELPEDVRPLALAVLRDRAQLPDWKPPQDSAGRFHFEFELVEDKDRFDAITWPSVNLFAENAMKLYGEGNTDANEGYGPGWVNANRKMSEMAIALIKARPAYYLDWLITAARVGFHRGMVGELLRYLLRLLVLLAVLWHVVFVIQRLRLGPAFVAGNVGRSQSYGLELNATMLIALSFALARLLQVILVAPPSDRHMSSAGVFLPTVAVVALFAFGHHIRSLLFARRLEAQGDVRDGA